VIFSPLVHKTATVCLCTQVVLAMDFDVSVLKEHTHVSRQPTVEDIEAAIKTGVLHKVRCGFRRLCDNAVSLKHYD